MSSPFSNRTPESYFAGLRRKDSKNALTTCRGVTDKGRACRRALASPKNSSQYDGAVIITDNVDDPAIYFCWQHKDQADSISHGDEGSVVSIKGRHSLEEAFRSLGLDDVDEEQEPASKEPSPSPAHTPQAFIPEPKVTVATERSPPHRYAHGATKPAAYPHERRRKQQRRQELSASPTEPTQWRFEAQRPMPAKRSLSLFSCCFGIERSYERDQYARPAVRPVDAHSRSSNATHRMQNEIEERKSRERQPRTPRTPIEVKRKDVRHNYESDSAVAFDKVHSASERRPESYRVSNSRLGVPSHPAKSYNVYRDTSPTPGPRRAYQQAGDPKSDSLLGVPNRKPLNARSRSSPDAQQLQRIHGEWPPPLPPSATDTMRLTYAKLLTAMSEQPSKTDTSGYIYIFWQTDVEQTDDETSAVATIISAPELDRGLQRQETVLQRRFFQTSANARMPETEKRTIFLKIGRAANVHQRMNQWRKQCEYEISLLRSYPYDSKGRRVVTPVPNVVKVERLIHLHLEMLGQRVSKQCRCGTEHKEWFEVGATSKDVREVDEIVRRWVRWSEDRFG